MLFQQQRLYSVKLGYVQLLVYIYIYFVYMYVCVFVLTRKCMNECVRMYVYECITFIRM